MWICVFMCIWIILALLLFIEFTGGDQEGDACLMLMCLSFYSVNLQKQSRIIGGVFLLSSILSYCFVTVCRRKNWSDMCRQWESNP